MTDRTEKEKMLAGELYRSAGPEITADIVRADKLMRAYNATTAEQAEIRAGILSRSFRIDRV